MYIRELKEIRELGKVISCRDSFAEQLRYLKNAGAKFPYIMDVRSMAYMRIYNGSKDGAKTCHATIYAKNSPIILAMVSPLIEDFNIAEQTIEADRENRYFVTKDMEVYDKYAKIAKEDANKEPDKRRALILPQRQKFLIKPDSEEAKALFKDVREIYFRKFCPPDKVVFYPDGINFLPTGKDFVDNQKGSIVGYLWFWCPEYDSSLDSEGIYLGSDNQVFGMLPKTSEAASQREAPSLRVQEEKITSSKLEDINSLEDITSSLINFQKY